MSDRARPGSPVGGATQPREIVPQLATAGGRLEAGTWFFERKLDGIRCLVHLEHGVARLQSRQGRPYAERLPGIADAVSRQASADLIADGELITFEDGATSFPRLQQALARRGPLDTEVWLYVFDLLWSQGRDLRPSPLRERKLRLEDAFAFDGPVRLTGHQVADHDRQDVLLAEACEQGWEGLIAKRPTAAYRGGRSRAWRKLPCLSRGGFVVGGWTAGARRGFAALLLGRPTPEGLRYVGKVGSGFDDRHRHALEAFLPRIERHAPAFLDPPGDRQVHWVEPVLTVLVDHLGWTTGGRLRQPRFVALVADEPPERDGSGQRDRPGGPGGHIDRA
ncbi:MAG: non-homologous end-joining DNA ligase [Nitriliruptoraceae bacterium]